MERLHAPWRIEYILSKKPAPEGESIFADIAASGEDAKNLVIARDKAAFALLNRYPYNGGHTLIVPYRVVPDIDDLTDEEMAAIWDLTRRCKRALTEVMRPQGFNIGLNLGPVAGAGIAEHLHLHIVPRWNGDTNFMPVLADTAILPEALEELADKLRTAMSKG